MVDQSIPNISIGQFLDEAMEITLDTLVGDGWLWDNIKAEPAVYATS